MLFARVVTELAEVEDPHPTKPLVTALKLGEDVSGEGEEGGDNRVNPIRNVPTTLVTWDFPHKVRRQAMTWSGAPGFTSMTATSSCRGPIDGWPQTVVKQAMRACSIQVALALAKPVTAAERPIPPTRHRPVVGANGGGVHRSAAKEAGLAGGAGERPVKTAAGDSSSMTGGGGKGQRQRVAALW